MVTPIAIAGRKIGPGHPCFVMAEAGVNHNGDLGLAKKLVDRAVEARVDAIKFQSFKAERLASASAPKASYQLQGTHRDESQQQMLRRLELSEQAQRELAGYCSRCGILFLSSPFDEESADLLEKLEVPAFKIPSGELTHLPFIRAVATKGKPMLVSTGMATLKEVQEAVATIQEVNQEGLVLLHCVSAYPAQACDANLKAMETLRERFHVPVGFSDHTQGDSVALAAVALGACVVEKHFTLDRNLPGPDHRTSLEPDEMTHLVREIRRVESALGDGRKEPRTCELDTAAVARKSLVAARPIPRGAVLTAESIAVQRPGTGLPPSMRDQFLGREAACDIPEGALLKPEMLR